MMTAPRSGGNRRNHTLGRSVLGALVTTAFLISIGPTANLAGSSGTGGTPAVGVLSVDTDPVGAALYIDGKFAGQTPARVDQLVVGDHRVRVAKEGYLENSRIVTIAGRGNTLAIKLTRSSGAEAAPAVAAAPGGGSKKWLWIGLAGGGAAAATAVAVLGKNHAPSAGTAAVTPNATGMAGVTSFQFTSQGAGDSDGDSLTYTWNFGDGASGSGQSTAHTYANPGTFRASVAISDGKSSVTAPEATVTVAANLSATWSGATDQGFSAGVAWTLAQSGLSLNGGSMTLSGPVTGNIGGTTGTVSQNTYPTTVDITSGVFTVTNVTGTNVIRFVGTTDATGSTMTGTLTTTNSIQGNFSKTATFHR